MDHSDSPSPHVLIFPFPIQGHLNSMLNLAELLCLANIKVTFLVSIHAHQCLTRSTGTLSRFSKYPGFRVEAIPDGLPDNHPRAGENWVNDLFFGLKSAAKPFLREILLGSRSGSRSKFESPDTSRVTFVIVDGILSFGYDVAKEAEVPVIAFRTISACSFWTYFCIPKLIEAEEIPFKDEDMDQLIQSVPGMKTFLRRRDLPSYCQVKDIFDVGLQHVAFETQQTPRAHALILNTFEDLEGPILSLIQAHCSKVYPIGPLHSHLKYRLGPEETALPRSSSSLWEVNRSCISWLDQKPYKSVVYVSFGSLTVLSRNQLMEIWAGLVQSKKYFLWVIRPNLIIGSDPYYPTPNELLEGTKERGCIVGWAPQEEVLAHPAIGGFWTHSGWNSTIESITAGVPMLCWPYFADQQVNSRYVSIVWKLGLDLKDVCDRTTVEKMVNDLMDGKRNELGKSATTMSELAKKSISEGGSSYCNLNRLIEDIKVMSKKVTP